MKKLVDIFKKIGSASGLQHIQGTVRRQEICKKTYIVAEETETKRYTYNKQQEDKWWNTVQGTDVPPLPPILNRGDTDVGSR